jgi:hypothetical protein
MSNFLKLKKSVKLVLKHNSDTMKLGDRGIRIDALKERALIIELNSKFLLLLELAVGCISVSKILCCRNWTGVAIGLHVEEEYLLQTNMKQEDDFSAYDKNFRFKSEPPCALLAPAHNKSFCSL